MKQRKKWAYLIGALLISFALVSCGQKSLPDGFDGDEVLKSARGVVEQTFKKRLHRGCRTVLFCHGRAG